MRKYIVTLTNSMIGRHRFYDLKDMKWDRFVEFVKQTIESIDVRDMNPQTLGKIMCAFETGDVMTSREEIAKRVHFTGDCEDFLREVVSYFLALVIFERLKDGEPEATIVPYHAYHPSAG